MPKTTSKPVSIHWFRQDLRLSDNPALLHAIQQGELLPIYVLDDHNADQYAMGEASRWWLHHALQSLNASLDGKLQFFCGDATTLIPHIIEASGASSISWSRCYEPWRIQRDKHIKASLKDTDVALHSDNASLLWEPWQVLKKDDTPYKVFTPFYRRGCLSAAAPRKTLAPPEKIVFFQTVLKKAVPLKQLSLLPSIGWDSSLAAHWEISEDAAHQKLQKFIEHGIQDYKEGRNFPAKKKVSQLSPYLHFGQISPNHVWYEAKQAGDNDDIDCLLSELGWREFSYSLLFHFPSLPRDNLQEKFNAFEWNQNDEFLTRWQQGMTGYPIVDAGMRELWQTGYMHNRVRMIVGSFLVKNLRLHWHHGEAWFWDCLIDADLASNSASWQWIAGCGADAAPYFRIFNPITQGEKFDKTGEYTRRFVPELADMPDKYLFKPWDAPKAVLSAAHIELDKDYPKPIVDVKLSREEALAAFKALKRT